jgi:hypothetical protein
MSTGEDGECGANPGIFTVTLTLAVTCALMVGYVVVTVPPASMQVCPLAPPLTLHLTNSGAGESCGIEIVTTTPVAVTVESFLMFTA